MIGKSNSTKGIKRPQQSGKNHPYWKGGKYSTPEGYIYIFKPKHPFSTKLGYVYEHRLIMEKYLGRFLKPKEVVHHMNHIKNDNRIENLMLMTNKSHPAEHKINTWSRHFSECIICHSQKSKHASKGICNKCYKSSRK